METARELIQKIENICQKVNQELEGADPQEAEKLLAAITHFAFSLEKIVFDTLKETEVKVDFSQTAQFALIVQEMQIILAQREYSKDIDVLIEDLE
ncbi:MAG: hypothetical protein HQM13_22700 [SAR324 cluster bacterium]|nr:hypothetical protein [SAR324 cluster bacterium]